MKKLKIGDLVYVKDVGFPYNRTDDGGESMEGASGFVKGFNVGPSKMTEVEFFFPILTRQGGSKMDSCVFHPQSVIKEDRPWLKKHLKEIFTYKKRLLDLSNQIRGELYE